MKTFKTTKKLCLSSILIVLLLVTGCSTEGNDPVSPADEPTLTAEDAAGTNTHLRQIDKSEPIYLSGFQRYYTYAVKSKEILQGGYDEGVPCDVMLEFLEGHHFKLIIKEYFTPPRIGEFMGTMTPGGQIKFSFASPLMILPDGSPFYITDIIAGHSGCELFGPGINKGTLVYQGYFDGERLLVSAPFYSKCEVEWPMNDLFPTPVEGPVHWKWTIDVTVD